MTPSERREQLIDAALQIIVEQGYQGVSIEAVARAAGVTRPVVYDHFSNLGALLESVIAREEQIALAQLEEVVARGTWANSAGPLNSGVRGFLQAVVARPSTWRIILLPLDSTPPIVREHVETNRTRVRQRLERIVRDEVGDDAVDAELAARSIMAFAEDAGRQVLTDPERLSPERYAAFVRSVTAWLAR